MKCTLESYRVQMTKHEYDVEPGVEEAGLFLPTADEKLQNALNASPMTM